MTENFSDATLYFKWMAHGAGYMGVSLGIALYDDYRVEGLGSAAYEFFTTHHSWGASRVVADDTWYYTVVTINPATHEAQSITSTIDYYFNGGTLFGDKIDALNDTQWEALQSGYLKVAFGDNYGGTNSWVILGEAMYDNNPVPEPATMLLLGSGLVGLAGFSRKKFKK